LLEHVAFVRAMIIMNVAIATVGSNHRNQRMAVLPFMLHDDPEATSAPARRLAWLPLLLSLFWPSMPAHAQATAEPARLLVIATKDAPPFAMQDENGTWSGISISLWGALAEELELTYRFEQASLADMIDGVADGRFDASIAAMTITPAREALVDFTHPFYTTGFGIAVRDDDNDWLGMAIRLLSLDFLKAIGLLSLLLAAVGLCFWLAERRHNAEEFHPEPVRGLGDGFWFSAVTMTTVGYGDMAPRTLAGRMVALVWMFTAILITSTFTGMIASSLTADRLRTSVQASSDLVEVATGTVVGSSSDEWLSAHGIGFEGFPDTRTGLDMLAAGNIEAFVYDRPLLRWLVRRDTDAGLHLTTVEFGRQDYGIALPEGSALRERLNRALLALLNSDQWSGLLGRYLGDGA